MRPRVFTGMSGIRFRTGKNAGILKEEAPIPIEGLLNQLSAAVMDPSVLLPTAFFKPATCSPR